MRAVGGELTAEAHNHFPELLAGLQVLMRLSDIGERKNVVHDAAQLKPESRAPRTARLAPKVRNSVGEFNWSSQHRPPRT